MAKNVKELVIYIDIGIVGVLSRFIEKATEKNYLYLEFYPLNSFPPKKVVYPVGIHKDHIHYLMPTKDSKGVEDRIILIYTGESGSLVKDILGADNIEKIKELRDEITQLKVQVATSKQESQDARSGVSKTIASMKSISRQGERPANSFGYLERGFDRSPLPDDNYEEFNDY